MTLGLAPATVSSRDSSTTGGALSSVTRSRKPSSAAIHVVKHTTSQHPTSGTRKCTVTVNAYTKLLEARLPPLQNPDSVLGADA